MSNFIIGNNSMKVLEKHPLPWIVHSDDKECRNMPYSISIQDSNGKDIFNYLYWGERNPNVQEAKNILEFIVDLVNDKAQNGY